MMSLIAVDVTVAVKHLGDDAFVFSLKVCDQPTLVKDINMVVSKTVVRSRALDFCFILLYFVLFLLSVFFVHTIIQKDGLHNKCTLPVGFIANISLLPDFPRLDQWSENTFLSDASLFMDGFLYISSGPAKTTLDRRGKDGERRRKTHSIRVFVSDLNGVFCQRSNPVKH